MKFLEDKLIRLESYINTQSTLLTGEVYVNYFIVAVITYTLSKLLW